MTLVAAIHVAVLFAIARSLGITTISVEPVTEATFVDKTRPPDEPPPPPREVPLERYESVVRPDYIPETAFDQPDAITEPPVVDTFEEPRGPVVVQPEIVSVRQDPRHPLSKPPYSARMIREGSQGTIDLEVFVQPNGRVSDARVVKSTGFEELDLAALAEAKRNWRLLPATRDGVPIAQWHRLRVTFKLNER